MKIARLWKSKVANTSVSELWEVQILKKCTPFSAKSKCQNLFFEALLEVERCTLLWHEIDLVGWKMQTLWCEAHFEVKMDKKPGVRMTLRNWDVKKAHAVVAPSVEKVHLCSSRFPSQNAQNSRGFGLFFDDSIAIRCRKSALYCGAEHIWKGRVSKTKCFKPLLVCLMSSCSQIEELRKS